MITILIARFRALTLLGRCTFVLAALACAMSLYYVVALLVAQQIMNGVDGIFWTIGQSLLNGYTLYVDIFETKPPLIFLFSAFSLWAFGNPAFGIFLHSFLLLGCVIASVLWILHALRMRRMSSVALPVAVFLFMTVVLRFLSRHPAAWTIEFFGLSSLCLYLLLFHAETKSSWLRTVLLTALLGCAVGMKESFLLGALGGVILLSRSWRHCRRDFILPVVLSAIIGVATLFFLGSLDAYFSVYLPEMFGYYTQRFYMPFLLKGLVFHKVVENLVSFSPAFLLLLIAGAIASVWLRAPRSGDLLAAWIFRFITFILLALLTSTEFFFTLSQAVAASLAVFFLVRRFVFRIRNTGEIVMAASAIVMLISRSICVILLSLGTFAHRPVSASHCLGAHMLVFVALAMAVPTLASLAIVLFSPRQQRTPLRLHGAALLCALLAYYVVILFRIVLPFVWTKVVFGVGAVALLLALYRSRDSEEGVIIRWLLRLFCAVYIGNFSVAMGSDFQGHHFLSIAPIALATFLVLVDACMTLPAKRMESAASALLLACSIVVILNPLRHSSLDALGYALEVHGNHIQKLRTSAARVDALLDACHQERYFTLLTEDFPAFTRHTPNNFFLWAGVEAVHHHPVVGEKTLQAIVQSNIVFVGEGIAEDIAHQSEAQKGALQYFMGHFSPQPWSCAFGMELPDDTLILFRTDREGAPYDPSM